MMEINSTGETDTFLLNPSIGGENIQVSAKEFLIYRIGKASCAFFQNFHSYLGLTLKRGVNKLNTRSCII